MMVKQKVVEFQEGENGSISKAKVENKSGDQYVLSIFRGGEIMKDRTKEALEEEGKTVWASISVDDLKDYWEIISCEIEEEDGQS